MQVETYITLFRWLLIGGVAGYVASIILKVERQGCLVNILLGIIGAFVGGFVFGILLGRTGITGWAFLDTTIHAVVGSVILLVGLELLLPGQQLGTRSNDGRGRKKR
ncbi:MAG: GlsB/YeaQ/YmgE family stress response membrane protein [Chloroflexi bacterium]|nr:GlsB/YeaQ/YmgE family stress response membrane protein [Chloroflexota bacterium]